MGTGDGPVGSNSGRIGEIAPSRSRGGFQQDDMSAVGEIEAKTGVLGEDSPGLTERIDVVDTKNNLASQLIAKAQKGSTKGESGVYISKDGKKNYLKFYKDQVQGYGEAIANNIYNALGLRAPKSVLFDPDNPDKAQVGKGVANEFMDGKLLAEHGVTPEIAKKILQGTAADILVANWDAVGLENDNILVSKDGEPIRIDNGGALMHRAMADMGRKPEFVLDGISDWDILSNDGSRPGIKNPSYAKVIQTAGYKTLEDMMPELREQVKKINALAKDSNEFEDLIIDAPNVVKKDRDRILQMLRARWKLLNEKVGTETTDLPDGQADGVLQMKKDEALDAEAMPQNKDSEQEPQKVDLKDKAPPKMTPELWQTHKEMVKKRLQEKMQQAALKSKSVSPEIQQSINKGEKFAKRAAELGKTVESYCDHLDNFVPETLPVYTDKGFDHEIGDFVLENMAQQKKDGVRRGAVTFLPNKGKLFVIGDVHERFDNVIAILDQIQKDPKTNLDKNPDNKIVFNGDIFATSKELNENGGVGSPDTMRGEAMLRFMGYLMARYPDQIFMNNGNHEMGVLLALKKRQDPEWESAQPTYTGAFKDLPREKLGVSNIPFLLGLIKNNSLAVVVGDKSKGEKTRVITHTAGEVNKNASIEGLAEANDPMEWREKYYSVYNGWSDLSPKGLQAMTKKMGADKLYFGHLDPSVMSGKIGSEAMPLRSTGTPIGEYKGGGVFVDTQTPGKNSGFVEIDLDNDKETVHTMDKVYAGHSPEKSYLANWNEALRTIVERPLSKATTKDGDDVRWLD